jgi:hypothetical protein
LLVGNCRGRVEMSFKFRGNRFELMFAFLTIMGVLVSLTSTLFTKLQENYDISFKDYSIVFVMKKKDADLPSKIQTLTASLNSASQAIGQIENEIKQRQELVQKLEKEADTASKIAALNKEQMDAVAQVLRSEIKSDERQNFWGAQLLAFFYAALGVGLSEGYRYLLRWRARRRLAAVE